VSLVALVLAAALAQPNLDVEMPDTVQAGSQFTLTISSLEPGCTGISCTPTCSEGLSFVTSRSLRSYSSRTVSGTTTTEQTCMLQLVFSADLPGMQTIGPLRVSLGPPGTVQAAAESVFVSGTGGAAPPGRAESGGGTWVETVPETGPYLPGKPFEVSYYLNTSGMVKNTSSYWCPPRNGVARLLDAPSTVAWQVLPGNRRRARLVTLEITPAGSGSLVLPVLQSELSMFSLWSGDMSRTVFGDTVRVEVSSFPSAGMPPGFPGIVDSVAVRIESSSAGGGDSMIRLVLSGPGALSGNPDPAPTVSGPADLLPAGSGAEGGSRWWDFLVDPDGDGDVVIGPDSISWFDPADGEYRHAVLPACTLQVCMQGTLCDSAIVAATHGAAPGSILPAALAAGLSLAVALFFLLKWRSAHRRSVSLADACDAEELLTAFEGELSRILTGRSRAVGADGIESLLHGAGVPQILSMRVLRNWKDLEQLLAGRHVVESVMERSRAVSIGISNELRAYLRGDCDGRRDVAPPPGGSRG